MGAPLILWALWLFRLSLERSFTFEDLARKGPAWGVSEPFLLPNWLGSLDGFWSRVLGTRKFLRMLMEGPGGLVGFIEAVYL